VREPEPEIIDRARKGDLRAFESLVRDYQADVWRFAYHLTRNRATAEDVTQEAFLKAYRGLGSYKGQAKFTSWLLRIVRNCAVDTYRKTRKETPTETHHERSDRSSPSPATEERIRINEAIRRLPLPLREPFVTIEVLGYSYQETAVILGLRVGTVKSRMHRARTALIESLADREAAREV
jgi:RNA polymerase sigma-70 factor (ECF subfamily)